MKKKEKADAEKRKSELIAEAVRKSLAEKEKGKEVAQANKDPPQKSVTDEVSRDQPSTSKDDDSCKDTDEVGVFSTN